jgi:predicted dehydrogenase
MKVAIIGAGLIGNKRASVLDKQDELISVCDKDLKKAENMAVSYNAHSTNDYHEILTNESVETVIISVINKYTLPFAVESLKYGKNILCEKPLGRNSNESKEIMNAANHVNKMVKTGFNHRFHPAVMKAKELIENDSIGELINIRARYGHGGRPGMEQEWRCSKELCGGGELIDQGVHLIDLCRWFTDKDVDQVYGKTYRSFWESDVEDNAFFHLEFDGNILAQCHVSWTNWKNIFSFEIFGKDGYIKIKGLGGSYGKETLEVGYRQPTGGIPAIEHFEFDDEDTSWSLEWQEFKQAIEENKEPSGSGNDGYEANVIIDAIYKSNDLNKPVSVN